jgi:hypothetical protein
MANKAEKFVKRAIRESVYRCTYLGEKGELTKDVYFKICTHLNNPDRWPPEYTNAYHKAFEN